MTISAAMAKSSLLKRQLDCDVQEFKPRKDSVLVHEVILMNILTFLPITSLLRFKFVCKRWYEIIRSCTFKKSHLKHNRFINKPLIQSYGDENKSIYSLLSVLANTIYGPRPKTPCCAVLGYANGFVCFRCNYLSQADYCLFDLNKREFFFLPECKVTSRPPGCVDASVVQTGFDFISAINDYKFVAITIGENRAVYVNLYTKSTNSWKEIGAVLPCFMVQFSVCTFNGKQIMGTGVDENRAEYVVYFDMVEEKFSSIEWPNKKPYYLRRLASSGQHLMMFACPDVWNKQFDGWLLVPADGGGYSWNNVISIGPMLSPFEPLGFWLNGKIILGAVKDEGSCTLQSWQYDLGSQVTTLLAVGVGSHVRVPCFCQSQMSIGMK